MMLEAISLVAGYRKDNILIENASFEIEPRTKCWIRCSNVDVARLFISIVLGKIRPFRGVLKVLGKRPYLLTSSSFPYYMRNLGVFWRNAPLISDATVTENLLWRLISVGEPSYKSLIGSALELVELKGLSNVKVQSLTPLERAKLILARAIVSRPPLIIALEPTRDFEEHFASRALRILEHMTILGSTIVIASSQKPPFFNKFKVIKLGDQTEE